MRLLRNVTYITHVYYNRPVTIPQLSIYRDVVGQVKLTAIYNLLNTIIYSHSQVTEVRGYGVSSALASTFSVQCVGHTRTDFRQIVNDPQTDTAVADISFLNSFSYTLYRYIKPIFKLYIFYYDN